MVNSYLEHSFLGSSPSNPIRARSLMVEHCAYVAKVEGSNPFGLIIGLSNSGQIPNALDVETSVRIRIALFGYLVQWQNSSNSGSTPGISLLS